MSPTPLKLWEARCAFTRAIAQLVEWANDDSAMLGYLVAFGEGLVAVTDARDGDHDGPHMAGGGHYTGLGMDLVVYNVFSGEYVTDGSHRIYGVLGAKWRTFHWLARWGGDFTTPDPDHFSFAWGGKA